MLSNKSMTIEPPIFSKRSSGYSKLQNINAESAELLLQTNKQLSQDSLLPSVKPSYRRESPIASAALQMMGGGRTQARQSNSRQKPPIGQRYQPLGPIL